MDDEKPTAERGGAPAFPAASPLREPLDEQGRERPRFVRDLPVDDELEPLIEAFCRGNFALIRREAPKLAERTDDEQVAAAARELLRRIQPDPVVKILLALAVLWLGWIVVWAYAAPRP